jgi:type IX secretion system PorP/SprF family membrane protein
MAAALQNTSRMAVNMKKLMLVCYAVVFATSAFSQQERQVSHYMYDHISYNPGSAGSSDMISTALIVRQQWTGIEGAPEDFVLDLSAPFKLGSTHHGIGLSLWQDKLGFNNDKDVTVSYAYQFSVANGRLGFGLSGNFANRKLDAKWDPTDNGDGSIPFDSQNEWAIDMGFGLFYQTDELYMGISSTHLLQTEYNYQPQSSGSVSREKLVRHYYITAGYTLPLSNPALEFVPSLNAEVGGNLAEIDLTGTLVYNKKFWGGVSYRVGSAVVGMVGVDILNGIKVGFAYDFYTSSLSNSAKSTYEIMIGYNFNLGIEKMPQKYKSIRYL